ncbi:peptidase C39 family protein [Candidatus Woesearchaeota archaeon]|nr:peptidase C39 family protein [Candidatus Woesearchaeota archaeon]MCF7901455.1 peptidase C39 family protein [Candidatus Woesearchaeota archaeon]MCF8013540.1 peptidase C39 family protein [Candidatus Woesearchaeota archaeon]
MKEYKQTTEYTCAASSLLMVINHFNSDFKLNQENEFEIWRNSANLPTRASSIFGLANIAKNKGITVEIIMESSSYDFPDYRFKGYKKVDVQAAEKMSNIQMQKSKENNINISIKEFHEEEIKKQLEQGKILMVRLNAGIIRETKSTSQYIVISEIKNEQYVVYDPLIGKKIITKEQLKEALETLHTKNKRDNRIIIFG